MMARAQIDSHMRAMIAAHGCLDSAAEAINARWGGNVCKGTLSRRLSGELPWTILDVIAIEDALGRFPVSRALARRQRAEDCTNVVTAAQSVAKEAGEAVAALTGAALCSSPTQRAMAVTELDEAIEAMRLARASLRPKDFQHTKETPNA